VTAKVERCCTRQAFKRIRRRLDYREYGGAQLLGVRGVCIYRPRLRSNDRHLQRHFGVRMNFEGRGPTSRIEAEFCKPSHRTHGRSGEKPDATIQ